jgi:LPS export ABC transporter permease LptG
MGSIRRALRQHEHGVSFSIAHPVRTPFTSLLARCHLLTDCCCRRVILDRYIIRSFLQPFLLCLIGFIGIWLIVDVQDNFPEFTEAKTSFADILWYYRRQVPYFCLLSLPIAILLGVLYGIGRLSRHNEIVSMLGSGRSVGRILLPVALLSAGFAAGALVLNQSLAPRAEANRELDLEAITKPRKEKEKELAAVTYRDPLSKRLWYARRIDPKKKTFRDVQVTEFGPDGAIKEKWYARAAEYRAKLREWHFAQGKRVVFSPAGEILAVDDWSRSENDRTVRKLVGWTETPERILSSLLDPEVMTVPQLRDFLRYHVDVPSEILAPYETYFQYRHSFPLSCIVAALIGGPLAVGHQRRGIVGAAGLACGTFFALMLLTFFFLALGKGGYVSPIVAAWLPPIAISGVGIWYLWLRSTHRDLPSFRFFART